MPPRPAQTARLLVLLLFVSHAARAATYCAGGEYFDGSNCVVCEVGYKCVDSVRTICEAGTYNYFEGCSVCFDCAAGTYQDAQGMSSCVSCPDNYECTATGVGAACADGFHTETPGGGCVACDAGSHFDSGSRDCVPCPAGYACPDASTLTICGAGEYSHEADHECHACDPSAGLYAPSSGLASCLPCPAGFACTASAASSCSGYSPEGYAGCLSCPPGTFHSDVTQACEACPEGAACPGGAAAAADCASGEFSGAGWAACQPCPAGYACAERRLSLVTKCPAGAYSQAGDATCAACAAGSYSASAGAGSCQPCADGLECSDANAAAPGPLCAAGRWPDASTRECEPCPDGYACDGATKEPCPGWTYVSADRDACVTCEVGHYCDGQDRVACAAGTTSTGGAGSAAACFECPLGFYLLDSVCTLCPAGATCAGAAADPAECAPGTYSETNPVACTACPAGYMCPGGSTITACATGNLEYALFGAAACATAAAGEFYNGAAAAPTPCRPGQTVGAAGCEDCAAGYYCLDPAAAAIQCEAGFYSPAGRAACMPCPAGYACEDRTDAGRQACDADEYSLLGEATCSAVPAGYAFVDAETQPTPCAPGTYNDGSGSTCAACPAGSYCPTFHMEEPLQCVSPLVSQADGATACELCPEGHACAGGAVGEVCSTGYADLGMGACQTCPAGYACAAGTRTPCAAGEYAAAGDGVCTACPAGSSCEDPAATPAACAAGHFSPEGDAFCYPCPAGYSCTSAASTACTLGWHSALLATGCTQCTAGTYCPEHAAAAAACPDGTYSEAGASACTPCPAGSSCDTSTGAVTACGTGLYSSEYELTCQTCPVGYSCVGHMGPPALCGPGEASAAGELECSECTSGACADSMAQTCDAGQYLVGAQCTDCPAGHYCTDTLSLPTICGEGTYNTQTKQTACAPCPAGSFCPYPDAAPIECPDGTYATSEAARSACDACPAGYSCQDKAAAPTECAEGQYILDQAGPCMDCPAGHYCEATSAVPTPCDSGYYQDQTGQTAQVECPAMSRCPDPTQLPVACESGWHSAAASVACEPCEPGHKCAAGHALCAQGTYAAAGDATCTECADGEACPAGSAFPVECLPGTYCTGACAACAAVPAGYEGAPSEAPSACNTGYYSPGLLEECLPCEAGYACPNSDGSGRAPCPVGSYSPEGTATCLTCNPADICPDGATRITSACQAGEYVSSKGDRCLPCEPGFECADGVSRAACSSGDVAPGFGLSACTTCAAGTYAPDAALPCEPCPAGTYQNAGGKTACAACPSGARCPREGMDGYETCPAGYYVTGSGQLECTACPAGYSCASTSAAPTACSAGQYSLAGKTACTTCPAGFMCPTTHSLPDECPAGHYALSGATECTPCPAGSYCPSKATSPVTCPPGYYSQGVAAQCLPCDAGFTCAEGSVTPRETICPAGSYCSAASATDTPCPAGTYSPREGVAWRDASPDDPEEPYCLTCPQGFYCPAGTDDYSGNVCPLGYYCPAGTRAATQYPCTTTQEDRATYGAATGLFSIDQCLPCPEGSYCIITEDASPQTCPRGYYCPTGSERPVECPAGTYTAGAGEKSPDACLLCTAGHYCPSPTTGDPLACPAGTYRDETGGWNIGSCVSCPAGSYCPTAGTTSSFVPCEAGHYCPRGSAAPTECPAGRFSTVTGATNIDACELCPEGYACHSGCASAASYIDCPAGYYCPEGTAHALQFPCPAGSKNTLKNKVAATDCVVCDAGVYCLEGQADDGIACPAGHYCLANTTHPFEHPCPEGTYRTATGAAAEDECAACTASNYCPAGSVDPQPCPAGYYNPVQNAVAPTPDDADAGAVTCLLCPAGSYCGEGVSSPERCAAGEFSFEGQEACNACLDGYYCASGGYGVSEADMLTAGKCPAGYYCSGSMDHAPGPAELCSVGRYCPEATPKELLAPAGYYQPGTGAGAVSDLTVCDGGAYCEAGASATTGTCEAGFYCPDGSAVPQQVPCPAGTYNPSTGESDSDACLECPQGSYCPEATVNPVECPAGYYCPAGLSEPTPCKPGTYSTATSLSASNQCLLCPAGKYCDGYGQTSVTGACDPGYLCISGATTPSPTDGTTGKICPAGGYCPRGAEEMSACDDGYYNPLEGARSNEGCILCPAGYYCASTSAEIPAACGGGYYCPEGASDPTAHPCSAGHYCPAQSTSEIACQPGTYQDLTTKETCTTCPEGAYCPAGAMEDFTACPVGFRCAGGAALPEPCAPGTYLDKESATMDDTCTACDAGKYCATEGLSEPTGSCTEGYLCISGASIPQPTDDVTGRVCSAGHYCPEGATEELACPAGTYLPFTTQPALESCLACPPGEACPDEGTVSDVASCATGDVCAVACAEGYYCESGATTETPTSAAEGGAICPTGHYCPEGSERPLPCAETTYAGSQGKATCDACPEGEYCAPASDAGETCPAGYYCAASTGVELVACGAGTYNPSTGQDTSDACLACPEGYYCPHLAQEDAVLPCVPGFHCAGGCADMYCSDESDVPSACPAGKYCPGGATPIATCPDGTYRDITGGRYETDCFPCPAGKYCAGGDIVGTCAEGYYCTTGATSATPALGATGGPCDAGYFCTGGLGPFPCAPGTYQADAEKSACDTCPKGSYCPGATADLATLACSQGYYCPAGSVAGDALECPAGTYGAAPGLGDLGDCTACPAGSYCAGVALSEPTGLCAPGYYCTGSATSRLPEAHGGICTPGNYCAEGADAEAACPAGKYCLGYGLEEPTGDCAPGYYCAGGSDTSTPADSNTIGDVCPAGSYCPAGVDEPTACPAGTYNPHEGYWSEAQCIACTPGMACPSTGTVTPNTPCAAGYYCPGGQDTNVPAAHMCSAGHYCPEGSADETPCPAGTFQGSTGQASCDLCSAGLYSEPGASECTECPAGHYCKATADGAFKLACPAGTYNPDTGSESNNACTACAAGFFCPFPGAAASLFECSAGYYCESGQSEDKQYACTAGHYCEAGSDAETACPAGTYNPQARATAPTACLACPPGYHCAGEAMTNYGAECAAGHYCTGEATSQTPAAGATGAPCPAGHYCPSGTAEAIPCPLGTAASTQGNSECSECPAGEYAGDTVGATGCLACPAGFYCPEGTTDYRATPCPVGTFSPATDLGTEGACTACTPGSYCDEEALTGVAGACAAGYYCGGGASSPTPDDDGSNGICPAGSYCSAGVSQPTACPAGTYNPEEGATSDDFCLACTAGHFCPSEGAAAVAETDTCAAGYYCVAGATEATPTGPSAGGDKCPAGTRCPAGSASPLDCALGTYQKDEAQGECLTCPEGYYCDELALTAPVECPEARYCPEGTVDPDRYLCPAGTYSASTGLVAETDCTPCGTGAVCSRAGLTASDGTCEAGFFCAGSATSARPATDNNGNGLCPAGSYCEAGAATPTACPAGTFRATKGAMSEADCHACTPGHYCAEAGLTKPTGPCVGGYYCEGGASTATPADATGGACPAGTYCASGSTDPKECSPGTYSAEASTECSACPAGTYCPLSGTDTPTPCPAGYYCPAKSTTYLSFPCPVGTYNDAEGGSTSGACAPCSAAYACPEVATVTPAVPCTAGYFCGLGATSAAPANSDDNGVCPRGSYCPEGSGAPTSCPAGTYNPSAGGMALGDCLPCPGGYYCAQEGMYATDTKCAAGYYCPASAETAVAEPDGYKCPAGHYCPEGTADPYPCAPGTYSGAEGAAVCNACPAGSYCPERTSEPITCPAGAYCSTGVGLPTFCADGTYSMAEGLSSSADCDDCAPGKFCQDGVEVGDCDAGFICVAACPVPNPSDNEGSNVGYECPIGKYCPKGSSEPSSCPENEWTFFEGAWSAKHCVPCLAGWVCEGDTLSQCPAGYYCPFEDEAQACPAATYNPYVGAESILECLICDSGYYCPAAGLSGLDGLDCPAGHYCPRGTDDPIGCPAGTYRDSAKGKKLADCSTCPKGHYCPAASEAPLECSLGTYCPAGSGRPYTCPLGTYATSDGDHVSLDTTCFECPKGHYCADDARLVKATCAAGFVCTGGATTAEPMSDAEGGYQCPAGYYCPAGALAPTACPAGTYSLTEGTGGLESCTACEEDHYNPYTAQTSCFKCGPSSTAAEGSTTCECVGANRAFQMTDGSCICKPGYEFYDTTDTSSTLDSTIDCQSIVYARCSDSERTESGACAEVDTDGYTDACLGFCNGASGRLVSGLCVCDTVEYADVVCNANCRANAHTITLGVGGTSAVTVSNPSDGSSFELDLSSYSSYLGSVDCQEGYSSCEQRLVLMDPTGFFGLFDYDSGLLESILEATPAAAAGSARALRTRDSSSVGIENPIICLLYGEAISFDVSERHYPVYDKDSLLNTNEDFDYGLFRTLARKMQTESKTTLFSFTFSEPGVYVFYDGADEDKKMIVTVQNSGQSCGEAYSVNPTTDLVRGQLGISANDDLILNPDWLLISFVLLLLVALAAGVIASFVLFNKYTWNRDLTANAIYRSTAQAYNPDALASKGGASLDHPCLRRVLLNKPARPAAAAAGPPGAAADVGIFWDFDVQPHVEELAPDDVFARFPQQAERFSAQAAEHDTELEQRYERIARDAEEMRGVLVGHISGLVSDQEGLKNIMRQDEQEFRKGIEMRKKLARRAVSVVARAITDVEQELRERATHDTAQTAAAADLQARHAACVAAVRDVLRDPEDAHALAGLRAEFKSLAGFAPRIAAASATERERRAGGRARLLEPLGALATRDGKKASLKAPGPGAPARVVAGVTARCERTGLVHPVAGTKVLTAGAPLPVTDDNAFALCVGPDSGKVYRVQGAAFVDRQTREVVHIERMGGAVRPFDAFVPLHPVDVRSALVVPGDADDLPTQEVPQLVVDPATGLRVPVVALAFDPKTSAPVPLGGTCADPLSGAIVPIAPGQLVGVPRGEDGVVPTPAGGLRVAASSGIAPVAALFEPTDGDVAPASFGVLARNPVTGTRQPLLGLGAPLAGGAPEHVWGGHAAWLAGAELSSEDALAAAAEREAQLVREFADRVDRAADDFRHQLAACGGDSDREIDAMSAFQTTVSELQRFVQPVFGERSVARAIEAAGAARKHSRSLWLHNLFLLQWQRAQLQATARSGAAPATASLLQFPALSLPTGTTLGAASLHAEAPPAPTKRDVEKARQFIFLEEANRARYNRRLAALFGELGETFTRATTHIAAFRGVHTDKLLSAIEGAQNLANSAKMTVNEVLAAAREEQARRAVLRAADADLVPAVRQAMLACLSLDEGEEAATAAAAEAQLDVIEALHHSLASVRTLAGDFAKQLSESKDTAAEKLSQRKQIDTMTTSILSNVDASRQAAALAASRLHLFQEDADSNRANGRRVLDLQQALLQQAVKRAPDAEPDSDALRDQERIAAVLRETLRDIAADGNSHVAALARQVLEQLTPRAEGTPAAAQGAQATPDARDVADVIQTQATRVLKKHRVGMEQNHTDQLTKVLDTDMRMQLSGVQEHAASILDGLVDAHVAEKTTLAGAHLEARERRNAADAERQRADDELRALEDAYHQNLEAKMVDLDVLEGEELEAIRAMHRDMRGKREVLVKTQFESFLKRAAPEDHKRIAATRDRRLAELADELERDQLAQEEMLRAKIEARRKRRKAELDKEHAEMQAELQWRRANAKASAEQERISEDEKRELIELQDRLLLAKTREIANLESKLTIELSQAGSPKRKARIIAAHRERLASFEATVQADLERQAREIQRRANARRSKARIRNRERENNQNIVEAAERGRLQRAVDEAESDETIVTDAMDVERTQQKTKHNGVIEFDTECLHKLGRAASAADCEQIFERHDDAIRSLKKACAAEKEKQQDLLQQRIAVRRRRQQENDARLDHARAANGDAFGGLGAAVDKAAMRDTIQRCMAAGKDRTQAAPPPAAQRSLLEFIPGQPAHDAAAEPADELAAQIAKAEQEHARRVELEAEQIRREHAAEVAGELETQSKGAVEAKQRALEKIRAEFEQRLSGADNEQDRASILEQQRAAQESMSTLLDQDAARQRQLIQERLERRKAQRLTRAKQGAEQERALALQRLREAQRGHQDRLQQAREKQAVVLSIEEHGEEMALNLVGLALQERHVAEMREIVERHARERALEKERVEAGVRDAYAQRRDEAADAYAAAMERATLDAAGPEQLAELSAAARAELDARTRELDAAEREELNARLESDLAEITTRHSTERFTLNKRQQGEISEMVRELFPEAADELLSDVNQKHLELEKRREQIAAEKQAELEQLQREQRRIEALHQQEMRARMRDLELELEREQAEDLRRQQQAQRALEERQQQLLEGLKAEQERDLRDAVAMTDQERKDIVRRHEEQRQELLTVTEREREAQNERLEERILARRRRRQERLRREMNEKYQQQIRDVEEQEHRRVEEQELAQIGQLNTDLSAIVEESEPARAPSRSAHTDDVYNMGALAAEFSSEFASDEDDGFDDKICIVGPDGKQELPYSETGPGFVDRAFKVREIINAYLERVDDAKDFAGPNGFVDQFDARIKNEGELQELARDELDEREAAAAAAGDEFLERAAAGGFARYELRIAATLPHTGYEKDGNTFCRSYLVAEGRRAVFMRRERLASDGQFLYILAHALAHAHSGCRTDTDARFLAPFYELIAITHELSARPDAARGSPFSDEDDAARTAALLGQFHGGAEGPDRFLAGLDEMLNDIERHKKPRREPLPDLAPEPPLAPDAESEPSEDEARRASAEYVAAEIAAEEAALDALNAEIARLEADVKRFHDTADGELNATMHILERIGELHRARTVRETTLDGLRQRLARLRADT